MTRVLNNLWAWLALAAMLLGLVLGVILVVALLLGGAAAVTLTGWAAALVPWCIGAAAVAMVVGLVAMYVRREHALTVNGEGPAEDGPSQGD